MRKFIFLLKKIAIKLLTYLNTYLNKSQVSCGKNVTFFHKSQIFNIQGNRNKIKIKGDTLIRGDLLIYKHGGEIIIGEYCYIGENTKIWSAKKIKIGDRVLISHNVDIHDSNDHPTNANLRHEHYKKILTTGHVEKINLSEKEIIIENDVWIGFNSTILKGVTIGKGAIVGAGSLVTKDVPPYTVVVGNPAKIVKHLDTNLS